MILNFLKNTFTNKHFQSLPNGRRVFFATYPWSGHYLIPNPSTEGRLFKITLWTNIFLFISGLAIFSGLLFLRDSAKYTNTLFWLIFFPLTGISRWILYRNELRNLQKIDLLSVTAETYQQLSDNLRTYSKGSLPTYEIAKLIKTSNSEEKIAMLKYEVAFPNILRFRLDGSIVWQAELPTLSNDVYTNLEWRGGKLHAFSRSCMSVLLDENTGEIISGR